MLTILIFVFVAYCAYKFFGGGESTDTSNKEQNMGVLKDTVSNFRNDLKPVAEQVRTATTNAKTNFEDAKHQRRIDAIVSDPKLLADALEARASKQGQLPSN